MTTSRSTSATQRRTTTPAARHEPTTVATVAGPEWERILAQLAEPFAEHEVQYRVGSVSSDRTTAQALAYADARVYEDRLNAVCPGAWSVSFTPWGEHRIICHLTIHGVTRSSTGEEGDSPTDIAGTAAEAQAFKRACSKFGLGRYLYALPARWLPYDPSTKRLRQSPQSEGQSAAARRREQIGAKRAQRMQAMLVQLGIPSIHHLDLAGDALGRTVTELATITEEEARAIWSLASRRNTEYGAPRHVPDRRPTR